MIESRVGDLERFHAGGEWMSDGRYSAPVMSPITYTRTTTFVDLTALYDRLGADLDALRVPTAHPYIQHYTLAGRLA